MNAAWSASVFVLGSQNVYIQGSAQVQG